MCTITGAVIIWHFLWRPDGFNFLLLGTVLGVPLLFGAIVYAARTWLGFRVAAILGAVLLLLPLGLLALIEWECFSLASSPGPDIDGDMRVLMLAAGPLVWLTLLVIPVFLIALRRKPGRRGSGAPPPASR